MSQPKYSRIVGTGSYLPSKILTNHDLEAMVDTSHEWIMTRTGISERRIADDSEATSDLGCKAARKALEMAGCSAGALDMIIVATLSPDFLFPSTAAMVQHKMGARKAAAMDLEAACTGFVYGLSVADQYIRTGMYKRVLVIGSEVLSRWVNWEDRTTCVLFADGAGAALVVSSDRPGICSTHLFADGSKGSLLCIPAGGSQLPISHEIIDQRKHLITMMGNETFKVAVNAMAEAARAALKANNLHGNDVDLFIPHQANIRIIEATAKKMGIPMERVMVNIHKYGNTSSGTIPIAMDEAQREGRLKEGDTVLLDAFGGGFTWGSALIKW